MDITYIKKNLSEIMHRKGMDQFVQYLSHEAKATILQQADERMKQTFTFTKTWDMECCHTPYTLTSLDWHRVCHDDEEWCFMLNRMDWQRELILAGIITNDHNYLKKSLWYTLAWIQSHPIMKPSNSTRTLDTGMRILNIFETLPYLYQAKLLSDEVLKTICKHLMLQIQYLHDHYLYKYRLSNWGSIQVCALLSVMRFLQKDYEQAVIYQWAIEELHQQFDMQVYPDGLHWEQSTMYHVEVLNYLMKYLYYEQISNQIEGKTEDSTNDYVRYQTLVYAMSDALYHQRTPNHTIEAFGDSDMVCPDDVFLHVALLYRNPQWKLDDQIEIDGESLYTYGSLLIPWYQSLPVVTKDVNYYDGVDSGMFTIRSDQSAQANFTMFTNGSLGSGHGHCDGLHFSLYHKGLAFLVDSGRYSYREDRELRLHLKSMYAHTSLIVDDRPISQPSGSWTNKSMAVPLKTYVKHVDDVHYIESGCMSTYPMQTWIRKLFVLDCGIWFLVDEVHQEGVHTYVNHFPLFPEVKAEVHKNVVYLQHKQVELHVHGEAFTQKQGVYSPHYNEVQKNTIIQSGGVFMDVLINSHIFCRSDMQVKKTHVYQGVDQVMDDQVVRAYTITCSCSECYTLVVFHQELFQGSKLCTCEGVAFHAKSVCIHKKDDVVKVIRLKM